MAACLITVSGTSGELVLKYKISSVDYQIVTGIGTFYIEDTATDVTYTTISGDVTAASGCLTVTSLPFTYYKFDWTGLSCKTYKTDKLIVGAVDTTLDPLSFQNLNLSYFAEFVNTLGDPNLKVTAIKSVVGLPFLETYDPRDDYYSFILRIIGPDIPELKIKNTDNTNFIYIKGLVELSAVPTGYTPVDLCETFPL